MTRSRKPPAWAQPGRLFSEGLVPLTARPTFFYDVRSAPLNGLYLGVLALLPWVLKQTFGGSDWEVAVLSAAPPLSHLFDIYYAHLCANRRKMPFVLWPGLVSRLMIVTAGLAVNSTMLVVFGALCYVVGSVATPAVNSIWRTNYPGSHRYRVVGTVMAVMNLCMAFTALAAGVLLQVFENGWLFRVVFAVGGVAGVLGVVVFSRIRVLGEESVKRAVPRGRFRLLRDIGLLWRDRKFGKYQFIQFFSGFANIMTLPVLIALLKDQGVNWVAAALVLGFAENIAKALTMPFWGRLLQRFNPMLARAFFSVVWAAGYVLIAFSGSEPTWVFLAKVIMGVAQGATMLLWSLQQMYFARKEDVPKYMGVHCTLTGVRGLLAPFVGVFLMKWLFHGDPHWVFLVSAVMAVGVGALSLRMGLRENRQGGRRGHVDGGALEDYTGSEP